MQNSQEISKLLARMQNSPRTNSNLHVFTPPINEWNWNVMNSKEQRAVCDFVATQATLQKNVV